MDTVIKNIILATNNVLCRQTIWKLLLCTSMSHTEEHTEEHTKQMHFQRASHHRFNVCESSRENERLCQFNSQISETQEFSWERQSENTHNAGFPVPLSQTSA